MPEYPFDEVDPQHLVAVQVGDPDKKLDMLDTVLDHSCFFEHLETIWKKSGKSKDDFSIVVKPHIIPMLRRDEVGVYTDPTLVLYLVRRIMEAGWPNVAVAEGRNSFGNYFDGRGVVRVAARAGYVEEEDVSIEGKAPSRVTCHVPVGGKLMPVDIVDLSHELVEHDFSPDLLGRHPVARLWGDADYRITFGKLKTHYVTRYALNLINVSLALPMEDRLVQYPTEQAAAKAVAALLEAFPVQFSLIDGITAADALLGYVRRPRSRVPGVIIAGQSVMATESLAAQMMGVDPFESIYTRTAAERLGGMTPYKVIGDAVLLNPWRNVRNAFVDLVAALMKYLPRVANYWLPLVVGDPDPCFPPKGGPKQIRRRRRLAWFMGARPLGMWLARRDGLIIALKKARIRRKVQKNASKMPLSAGYPEFFEEARHLSKNDISLLIEVLALHGNAIQKCEEKVVRAGHIIMVGENQFPFFGPDALGAISAGRILQGAAKGWWTPAQVLPELKQWRELGITRAQKLKLKKEARKKLEKNT